MNLDHFESELRAALQRKEPAKGFADRVAKQVGIQSRPPSRRWLGLAVAASLILGSVGVVRYEEYRRAEHAKNQLLLALHITANTLDRVERKLNEQ